MANKKNVVLYFTVDANPTEEDFAAMNSIPGARQRNASLINPDDKPEPCDAVAGPAIPEAYDHLPRAKPVQVVADDKVVKGDGDAVDPEDLSVAELKAKLDEAGVEYKASAKKAELVALYEANIETE